VTEQFDVWQLIGGIGLFLFAMAQLEAALRDVAGRSFKRLLQSYTDRPTKSVIAGAVTTGVLQSSSLVGLMVLAFVGAGLMTLKNALGVIFGANFGTTLTGWLVATLGFKLDLDSLALPLIGIGSIVFVVAGNRIGKVGRLFAALGLLLLGLSLMKDSVSVLGDSIDIARLASYSPWQFLLFGTVVAAVIQSSSATMMITMTALHAGVIDLPAAAAIAIGADLGTTTTVLAGAIQGAAAKKRVALAHFIFNLTNDGLAFLLRLPLLAVIAWIGIVDPLFALVAFHSLFNLLGIALFLPLTGVLARFLERRFQTETERESQFLADTTADIGDAGVAAITKETSHLLARVIDLNMRAFVPALPTPPGRPPVAYVKPDSAKWGDRYDEAYRRTKKLEGEMLAFAIRVQAQPLEPAESERLQQLLNAVRHGVHSAKSLRDIRHNLADFEDSAIAELNRYVDHFRAVMTGFYGELFRLGSGITPTFRDFAELLQRVHGWHDHLHSEVFDDINSSRIGPDEISSLLNVNREILNSNVALLMAIQEFHLKPAESIAIGQLPGAS